MLQALKKTLLLIFSLCFIFISLPSTAVVRPVKAAQKVVNKVIFQRPVEFFVLGDWGCGLKGQFVIAKAMKAMFLKSPVQFILTVGDNIYPMGDINALRVEYFEKPYDLFLQRAIPFYPTLGNHDTPHADDQVRYFKIPGRCYTFTKGNIQFFAIDTNLFDVTQAKWLSKVLASSKAQWKIVYGHHPIISSGPHGNDIEPKQLNRDLRPILEKYHVDFYVCGHDHDYERFKPVNGVYYVISGGGGASLREFRQEANLFANTIVHAVEHEYMWFKVDGNKLYARAYGGNNKLIDSFYLSKK